MALSSDDSAAPGDGAAPGTHYAYRASLVGGGRQFELTDAGLAWEVGRKSGLWRYADIASIRLSYRPVSMQSRRFRADIANRAGDRVVVLSTTWQTVALMARQDIDYRAFIVALHRRLAEHGSTAKLSGGLGPVVYTASLAVLAMVAVAMAGLLLRALFTGALAGALFILGFAALFAWQVGGFLWRNQPRHYSFDELPLQLLP